ncbi:transposase domain-containing protein [Streptomyces nigrescens]|uniref:transposase domain-containing protein n=1 Tax=Streptomyces nigrescens TaxID=1920 RepID=UPI00361D8713
MVDEVLVQTGRVQARIQDLPSPVVGYLLLAGCRFPQLGGRQVWQRLTAGPARIPVAAPTCGALLQARRRVRAAPLRWLCAVLPRGSVPPVCGGAACWSARSTARR